MEIYVLDIYRIINEKKYFTGQNDRQGTLSWHR